MDQSDNSGKRTVNRRKVLALAGAAGVTLMLPTRWTKPVVESIIVPAHAQASPATGTTTTVAPTTTLAPTTTGTTTTTTTTSTTTTTVAPTTLPPAN